MPAPHWFFPRSSHKTANEHKLITTDERDSFGGNQKHNIFNFDAGIVTKGAETFQKGTL